MNQQVKEFWKSVKIWWRYCSDFYDFLYFGTRCIQKLEWTMHTKKFGTDLFKHYYINALQVYQLLLWP